MAENSSKMKAVLMLETICRIAAGNPSALSSMKCVKQAKCDPR